LFAVACIASSVVVGEPGIYDSHRVGIGMAASHDSAARVVTLHALAKKRRLWLPAAVADRYAAGEATR
jgi:hypothetical protein